MNKCERIKKENPHRGHRARMRSRYRKNGLDSFADHEVLEFALFYVLRQVDTNSLAHRLLERFGSLANVFDATPEDLMQVDGMGEKASAFLSFIPQLARCYLTNKLMATKVSLTSSEAAMEYAIPLMAGRTEEVFYVISLNAACRVLQAELLAKGTVAEVRLHPRQIIEVAIRNRASSVIFIHNHPSGTIKPSTDDLRLTESLQKALHPLSIKVLDHIIVSGDKAFSFAKENVLPKNNLGA